MACLQAMSMNDIKFEEGQSTDQYASQLVKLLQQSVRSSESLARKPLIEHLKRQADGIPICSYCLAAHRYKPNICHEGPDCDRHTPCMPAMHVCATCVVISVDSIVQ